MTRIRFAARRGWHIAPLLRIGLGDEGFSGVLTAILLSAPIAHAADPAPPPPILQHDGLLPVLPAPLNLTGFYAGVVGGWAFTTSDHSFVDGTVDTGEFAVQGG